MKRILIIDDEPETLAVMQEVFEVYTCRVYIATTGRDGIAKAKSLKPEIILLDLRLPDMRGEDILPQLKSEAPQSKVIIGTAYGANNKREELLKAGADGFFDKPINLTALEKRARELVGNLSEIRLLMIEDDERFCQTLKEILENDSETKWKVFFASTGEGGIALTREQMPDLITLDICLAIKGDTSPLSNGVEVYRELKKMGVQIPIVVLAAAIDSPDVESLTKEGVATLFAKDDLHGVDNLNHFMNVLKRIALRGTNSPKTRSSN